MFHLVNVRNMNAGRNAVITGGMRGIGLYIGKALLRTKLDKLCVWDLRLDKITFDALRKEFPKSTIIFQECDVSKWDAIDRAYKETIKSLDQLDIIINNAGVFDDLHCEKTLLTGLCGVINSSLLGMQHMSKEGRGRGGYVINIASTAGIGPVFFAPIYSASKWGVVGFTRSMGFNDYYDNKTGVKFIAICPGRTQTQIGEHLMDRLFLAELKKIVETQFISKVSQQHVNIVGECVLEAINTDKNGSVFIVDQDFIKLVELPELAQDFVSL